LPARLPFYIIGGMSRIKTLMLIVLILLPFSIGAAITVTYEPNTALHFELGSPPMNTAKLVAHIGTLTFTTTGNSKLYDPFLTTTAMTFQFKFTGPIAWSTHWQTGLPDYQNAASLFYLYAVSTANGRAESNVLDRSGQAHPLRTGIPEITTNPFVVKLYVQSDADGFRYQPGGNYVLTEGVLGGFQIVVANTAGGYYSGGRTNTSVNGASPTANTPILAPGTNPSEPIIYGDPPQQVIHDFQIINKQTINLTNAVGNLKAKVAEAQITVSNGQANKNYDVNVIFTNQANTNPFRMVMQNVNNPPSIPYSLYFNNRTVTPGDIIPWTGLKNGTKNLDIQVTGVSTNDANLALSGSYKDVIVVNVIPIDTI